MMVAVVQESNLIELFTDGSSRGNPGPGGYGVILRSGNHYKELSQGFRRTTNNRMELMAVLAGLEALKIKGSRVLVWSDSKYVVDSVEKGWVFNWKAKNFAGKKNADLWKHFLRLNAIHQIKFKWIKGHADHPENERCDELATNAADGKNLPPDTGFESGLYS
jgi:ribonuclease HI